MSTQTAAARTTSGAPQNLVELLLERAKEPGKVAITHRKDGAWAEMTWGQALEEVQALSAGLVGLGLQPGERVAIFGGTTPQWMLCDLAVSAAGGITVPIYASNTPDEVKYILNNSEASYVFVDHDLPPGRLGRVRARLSDCPSVRKVIAFEGATTGDQELPLADLRQKGAEAHQASPGAFAERVAKVKADDLSTIIYTSGTTGDPKGVMQTHAGWAYQATSLEQIRLMQPTDGVMLFLPFAHVFGQLLKSGWLSLGYRLIFAESPEKLLGNLAETHPTLLPTVPRVIERIYNGVLAQGGAAPGMKGRLFRWAMSLFDEYVEARKAGRPYRSLSFSLARKLVFAKAGEGLKQKLGGKLERFVTGGAPLSAKIGWLMELLGFVVVEGYGLTESTAIACVNPPYPIGAAKIGTVGPPLPGTTLKLAPDGEVLIRGPSVMKGYFKNPQASADALDPEGWLRSGDIGEIDQDGFLRITDRKKDIIITAGGKNVAPQNLENALKAFPIVNQAMVYGDKRPYLTALITVSEEVARKVAGGAAGTYAELAQKPEVKAAVQAAVDAFNASQPSYSTIKKFSLLDHDLSQEGGELTPTSKVKRARIIQLCQPLLDSMYEEKLVE
ncbi:MAG TPA: long-chain fatty acid--CoA ligase [Myxococcales bacterium]|nr:long-chain fatty acid--CoA ligase [Myxococcales bacterium]